jgi:serine/threonine protein kinase
MDRLLAAGTLLDNRFRITEVVGHSEGSAAYLAADLDQGGAWTLVWESTQMFRVRQKPEGVLHYLLQDDLHYLVLLLEGQDLGLIYTAAGVLEESWAALWMSQVCDGIGQWHTRSEERLVCLAAGDIRLANLRLTVTGRAILPSRDLLSQPVEAIVPGQSLSFAAPEKALGEPPTILSDVYALGAAVYCLVAGTPPPDPKALHEGQAELVPPRKIQGGLSSRLEKTILKAMSLDSRQRHVSAMQLSFELDRCVPRRLRRHRIGEY